MASIFTAAKQMINKITDDMNKDKWDKSCINQALFTDPEPGKLVPPARQDSRPVPPEKPVNVQPAVVPAQADVQAMTTAAVNTAAPLVATAPQIEYSTDKPQIKQSVAAAEPEKKEPVKFINSRFNRSINYVTSKVVKPAGGVRSISDLPVVDPSQSISSISGMTLGDGGEPIPEVKAEIPEAQPVEVQPEPVAVQPAATQPKASQPSPAVAAAMLAAAQLAAQQSAAQQSAAQAAVMPVQPAAAQPVPAAAQFSAIQPAPAVMEIQPEPVMAQAVPVQPVVMAVQEPVAVETPLMNTVEEVQPAVAEEETEKCYYVLITHTKTQPVEGKRVLMRNCDFQYAWTDSMDESEKPAYDTCPVCGKAIEYIETEMD